MAVWSQIAYSQAITLNRLDAEYFQPENLAALRQVSKCKPQPLSSLAFVTDGIHASPEIAVEGGIRYLSAKCVKDNSFTLADALYITNAQNAASKRTQLRPGDVLITSVGTIGNAAVVQPDILPANADRHLGIVRVNQDSGIDPYYLATFLNSRYGRFQTLREATGNVQLNLFIEKIKTLLIPRLPVEQIVVDATMAAYEARKKAETLYETAEAIVTAALGLDRVDLTPRLFYEDTFGHAADACRFDAEYYQPAKWNVLRALAAMPGKPLGEHFRPVQKLWQPTEQPASTTVRNYDLTDALTPFLDDTTLTTTAGEIKSTKKRLEPGDLVVSRLRSYLKEIAVVLPSNGAPLVGSTEFIVLRPRESGLSVEALLVFLRSAPVQTVLKWCQDGSNHPRFAERELLRLSVPDTVLKVQDEISLKIKDAISARQESRRLLDEAKRIVEEAIEETSSSGNAHTER